MKHYFFVGMKGMAMSNIAVLLQEEGNVVSGVDVKEIFPTDAVLTKNNIYCKPIDVLDLPSNIDTVVYSAAHGGTDNWFVKEAIAREIPVLHQAELLGELMGGYENRFAVAGCHGKTTTSSLLAYALTKLGVNPTYLVGAPSFNKIPGSHIGAKQYFVIEADEYALHPPIDKTPKFLLLHPTHAIITNIDFDHPDVYKDLADTQEVFIRFMKKMINKSSTKRLVLCGDNKALMDAADQLPRDMFSTYGTNSSCDFRIEKIQYTNDETSFKLMDSVRGEIGTFSIKLAGEKNVSNAAGVIVLLMQKGFETHAIAKAISDFTGARRRFEEVMKLNNTIVIDDYAHHPSELEAIIQAARSRYPTKKITVIFQPHTFSRTSALFESFGNALAKADISILLPIFASAREQVNSSSQSSALLAEEARKKGIETIFSASNEQVLQQLLAESLSGNDVILMAGAGDIYKYQSVVAQVISQHAV